MPLHLPWRRGTTGAANPDPVALTVPRPAREWASVAPLLPSVRDHPPALLDPRRFRADLATTWSTPPALQRLGHLVTPEAPAGLLQGLAVPVHVYDAPQLRFAPAPAELPTGPAASRSWWPTALSRRAQPETATTAPVESPRRPDVAAREPESERAFGPEPSGLGAGQRVVLPVQVPEPAAPDSTPISATAETGPTPTPAVVQTAASADDGLTRLRPTLGVPAEPGTAITPPPHPLPRPAVHDQSARQATFVSETPGESRRKVAGQPSAASSPVPAAPVAPARAATFRRETPGESQPKVALEGPLASSPVTGEESWPGADSVAPAVAATFLRETPGESQPRVALEGSLSSSAATRSPVLRDIVGARDLPRALAPRHDVIGAPSIDGGAVRPSRVLAQLGATWRQTERPVQQVRDATQPAAPLDLASTRSVLPGATEKNLGPPPGLLAQLERAVPIQQPMSRGVELLNDRDHATDSAGVSHRPDGSDNQNAEDISGLDDSAADAEDLGGHDGGSAVSPAADATSGRPRVAMPELAGLGPALRQVRRGAPARASQRRATTGVVWPTEHPGLPIAPQPGSPPDGPANLAPMAHPRPDDAPADASAYPSSAPSSSAARDAPPPATANLTPQDVADVVRHALLRDRERSGSLADLW